MNTRKVVYNACYGGFSLSKEAVAWCKEHGAKAEDDYDLERWSSKDRHNPILVACVEALGVKSYGGCAHLEIAEVEGPYRIDEYDGYESVQTPNSYEWS